MSTVTGIIEVVGGPNTGGYYSLKVGGVWHGAGKSRPGFEKGANVSFDAYLKDGKYSTIKGSITAASAAPEFTGQSTAKSSYQAKDDYWAAKEKYDREVVQPRITYLAAFERAVAFADLALRNGALAALEKAKPVEKLDILQAFVDEQTDKIIAKSNGKPPKAGVSVDSDPNEQNPDDSNEEWQ